MNENFDIARHHCLTSVRLMAIQIIARDRRIAQALVEAERRTEERRHELQYAVVRETKAGW